MIKLIAFDLDGTLTQHKTKQCDCGMEHCCDIKEVIIEVERKNY